MKITTGLTVGFAVFGLALLIGCEPEKRLPTKGSGPTDASTGKSVGPPTPTTSEPNAKKTVDANSSISQGIGLEHAAVVIVFCFAPVSAIDGHCEAGCVCSCFSQFSQSAWELRTCVWAFRPPSIGSDRQRMVNVFVADVHGPGSGSGCCVLRP